MSLVRSLSRSARDSRWCCFVSCPRRVTCQPPKYAPKRLSLVADAPPEEQAAGYHTVWLGRLFWLHTPSTSLFCLRPPDPVEHTLVDTVVWSWLEGVQVSFSARAGHRERLAGVPVGRAVHFRQLSHREAGIRGSYVRVLQKGCT